MNVRAEVLVGLLCWSAIASAGPFAPPAGQPGSTAIAGDSSSFVEWASGYQNLARGPQDIANPGSGLATYGSPTAALGPADATTANGSPVVSLGDGGSITLTFPRAITDGTGFDFAVFENGFADGFLELALVEVSTNGQDFVRFPATSLTPTTVQAGGFDTLDATNLDGLAGTYRAGFGTPFDLAAIVGLSPLVDPRDINYVRIVDVVGSTDPAFGTLDSHGNLINDPYPTPFASGGFDLDAVGVLNAVPEPGTIVLAGLGLLVLAWAGGRRRRPRHPPA